MQKRYFIKLDSKERVLLQKLDRVEKEAGAFLHSSLFHVARRKKRASLFIQNHRVAYGKPAMSVKKALPRPSHEEARVQSLPKAKALKAAGTGVWTLRRVDSGLMEMEYTHPVSGCKQCKVLTRHSPLASGRR